MHVIVIIASMFAFDKDISFLPIKSKNKTHKILKIKPLPNYLTVIIK